jgi:branched-chain amino acid transport system substrate-binding protein
MAVKEINESGGFKIGDKTYTFELIHYDTEGKIESATAATEKLISQDKVPVIIGTSVSSETAAMIPIAEREKTPLITMVAASDILTRQGARFFTQAAPANINYVAAGVKTLKEMGIKNVAIIYLDDAWGQSYAKLYPPKIQEAGIQIVAQEPVAPQQKEFVTLLNKVKAKHPDGILLAAETELAVPLLKQIHEVMPDVRVMETGGTIPEEAMKLAPEAAEGLITLTRAGEETPEIKEFKERFKAAFGYEANSFHFSGRDGIYLVMDAMKRAESVTDKEKINDAIRAANFKGLIGTYTFNEKGENSLTGNRAIIKDGQVIYQSVNEPLPQ